MKFLLGLIIACLVGPVAADHPGGADHSHDKQHGYYYHQGSPRERKGPIGVYKKRYDQKQYGYDIEPYELKQKRRVPGHIPHYGAPGR